MDMLIDPFDLAFLAKVNLEVDFVASSPNLHPWEHQLQSVGQRTNHWVDLNRRQLAAIEQRKD